MHVMDVKCCNIDVIKWNYMVLHPASIVYMTDYILPLFITWHITSCLYSLHVRLHPASNHYMANYILPRSITCSITCSRIHYMLPNPLHPLHAPESITCDQCSLLSINGQRAGPSAATQRSLCRPAGATSARGKQSFFCWIQFARQYSSVQRSDMQHTDEVAASTRSLHN